MSDVLCLSLIAAALGIAAAYREAYRGFPSEPEAGVDR